MAIDRLFVDTSAFIAVTDRSDHHHQRAAAYFRELLQSRHPILTTNFILDETYTRLKRKLGSDAAITFGGALKKSVQVDLLTIDEEIETLAWKIFKKYRDQDFSYTDCTSFAVMKRKKIRTAFTFDAHFQIFGFQMLPPVL